MKSTFHSFRHCFLRYVATLLFAANLAILPGSVTRWALQMYLVAQETHLTPEVLACIVLYESRGDSEAVSPQGAVGLMQIVPLKGRPSYLELLDPHTNLQTGAQYLSQLVDRNHGDLYSALLDYNAGPYRNGIPWETRLFADSVQGCINSLQEHPELATFYSPFSSAWNGGGAIQE